MAVTREEARRYMESYAMNAMLLDRFVSLMCDTRDRILKVTQSYDTDAVQSSGDVDKLGAYVERMEELGAKFDEYATKCAENLDGIVDMVGTVGRHDLLHGQILALRYLRNDEPMTLEEVAERLGYSVSMIWKEHPLALDDVASLLEVCRQLKDETC